jgi:hypothetical protein
MAAYPHALQQMGIMILGEEHFKLFMKTPLASQDWKTPIQLLREKRINIVMDELEKVNAW